MLVADGIANTPEELGYLFLKWYRNGYIYTPDYNLIVQRQYPKVRQEVVISDSEVAYEDTGKYEVALTITMNDPESICQAYYGNFLAPYYRSRSRYSYSTNKSYEVPLSWGYIDVSYYKGKYLP